MKKKMEMPYDMKTPPYNILFKKFGPSGPLRTEVVGF